MSIAGSGLEGKTRAILLLMPEREGLYCIHNPYSALGVGDLGLGHTIHWSMAGVYDGTDIWSTETERILTNIAAFAD